MRGAYMVNQDASFAAAPKGVRLPILYELLDAPQLKYGLLQDVRQSQHEQSAHHETAIQGQPSERRASRLQPFHPYAELPRKEVN